VAERDREAGDGALHHLHLVLIMTCGVRAMRTNPRIRF
jgi:hypothetical protein